MRLHELMPKILLIDDDKDYLGIMTTFLNSRGYALRSLDTWSNADAIIMSFKPDLIVLDVFLGGYDGLSACQKLKANSYTRDIPILIISGYPKLEDTAINRYGAEDFIAKPFSIQHFLAKIQQIIERHSPN